MILNLRYLRFNLRYLLEIKTTSPVSYLFLGDFEKQHFFEILLILCA